jgi:hypothetical protein
MDTTHCPETLINIYQTTTHHIPDNQILHIHHYQNLKYHNSYPVTQLQVSSVGTRNCLAKVQGSKSNASFDHICLRFMRSVRHKIHFIISYEFVTMVKKQRTKIFSSKSQKAEFKGGYTRSKCMRRLSICSRMITRTQNKTMIQKR